MTSNLKVTQLNPKLQSFLTKIQARKKLSKEIKDLRCEITPLFEKFAKKRVNFETDVEVCDVYGNCQGLKLDYIMNTTYLGKAELHRLEHQYFKIRFDGQPAKDIATIAEDATRYIWEHRKSAGTKKPCVKVVYVSEKPTKRQKITPSSSNDEFEENKKSQKDDKEEEEDEDAEEEEEEEEEEEDD